MGRIAGIDAEARTLRVRTRDGEKRFHIAENVRLMHNNRRDASLKDFEVGDMIRLRHDQAEKGKSLLVRAMMGRSGR